MQKNALITGAGQRIGRAIALKLAEDGWNIALHYRNSASVANELANTLEKMGRKVAIVTGDLNEPASVPGILQAARSELGPITCLINNASRFEPDDIATMTAEDFTLHMNTNLLAPALLSQVFAAQFETQDLPQGNIINIVDQRVLNLRPDFLSYTLSKAALWTLTQSNAMALAPKIRVNAIGPGPTLANKRQSQEGFEAQCRAVPLEYGPTPNEIASGVTFLMNATSITGELLTMDGGQHLPTSLAIEE